MQHPSYIALGVVSVANVLLIERLDGVMGCVLPEAVARSWARIVLGVGLVGFGVRATRVRVQDEEEMLRRSFGREWEEWHARTKRFVPGVI